MQHVLAAHKPQHTRLHGNKAHTCAATACSPPCSAAHAAARAPPGGPRPPPSAHSRGGGGGAGASIAGFSSGLDFSAPAVKLVPRPDAPGGIPDVELFALRVPGIGLLGVAAAGAFFGLRGLLAAACLGEQWPRRGGKEAGEAGSSVLFGQFVKQGNPQCAHSQACHACTQQQVSQAGREGSIMCGTLPLLKDAAASFPVSTAHFRPHASAPVACVCCLTGYLYLRMGGTGQPGAAAGPGTAAAGGSSSGGFFTQQQQQQQPEEGGFTGGLQRPGATGQASAFKGKAYKLGGS